MALPSVGGIANLVLGLMSADGWMLEVIDPAFSGGEKRLVGQEPPERLSIRSRTETVRTSGMNDYHPLVLPSGGAPDAVSFRATFRTTSDYLLGGAHVDLKPILRQLQSYRVADPNLGRPPMLKFSYAGDEFICWLTSVDSRMPHGTWKLTGNPITYEFDISLEAAGEHEIDMVDPASLERETIYHPLAQGETPESVAMLYHDDPMLGIKVRENNPSKAFFVPGDVLRILDASHSKMTGSTRPRAVPYLTIDGLERLQEIAKLRETNGGTPWYGHDEEFTTA
jgi:hypothetical protein